jgi:hypothetical protein
MLKQPVIGCHKNGRDVHYKLSKLYPATALVRSTHEENSIGGKPDGSVFS